MQGLPLLWVPVAAFPLKYVRMYVRTYVFMYVRMYVCTYVRMYVCIFYLFIKHAPSLGSNTKCCKVTCC